jgi:hypothetical protein
MLGLVTKNGSISDDESEVSRGWFRDQQAKAGRRRFDTRLQQRQPRLRECLKAILLPAPGDADVMAHGMAVGVTLAAVALVVLAALHGLGLI